MSELSPTPRTQVRRLPKRASYERAVIEAILDEGLVCHVGFIDAGQPFVIPTIYGRSGERLLLHGSAASRMLGGLAQGVPVCVTVTLLDGLVLARSAFHHSMNYRSVVLLGTARELSDPEQKSRALHSISEHIAPGRWAEVRPPSQAELRATTVLELPIREASAKIRTGPPLDDEPDYALPCWAGELPLALVPGAPRPDPRLPRDVRVPPGVAGYARGRGRP